MTRWNLVVVGAALSVILGIQSKPAISATLLSADKADQVVVVRNITVREGVVSGELVNKSSRPLRDVQLLIRYTWLWNNEFHPGKDDPGTSVYHTVEQEIAPGGTASFTYKPSFASPSRADGRFETTVTVAGFTEIVR